MGGKRLGTLGSPGYYGNPALSPDDTKVAVSRLDPATGNRDIWVMNPARGTTTRLTSSVWNDFPLWSPTGSHVIFRSQRSNSGSNLYRRAPAATGPEDLLLSGLFDVADVPSSWTPEGDLVVGGRRGDLWLLPRANPKNKVRLRETDIRESEAELSPDGRSMASTSLESGQSEVYLSRFPWDGERRQISSKGGTLPVWRRDGHELFYLAANGHLMAVRMDSEAADAIDVEERLETNLSSVVFSGYTRNLYAVAHDGQQFLVNEPAGERSSAVTVVVNWPSLLER